MKMNNVNNIVLAWFIIFCSCIIILLNINNDIIVTFNLIYIILSIKCIILNINLT